MVIALADLGSFDRGGWSASMMLLLSAAAARFAVLFEDAVAVTSVDWTALSLALLVVVFSAVSSFG